MMEDPRGRGVAALLLILFALAAPAGAAPTVARQWNEALLEAIRHDYARPTVHARNLFHLSVASYDAWAAFEPGAGRVLLGNRVDGFSVPFDDAPFDPGLPRTALQTARDEAISYAAYRLLSHRFVWAPASERAATQRRFDELMAALGYDAGFTSTDWRSGSPAALGNYIADRVIAFGMRDGANEANDYASRHYTPVNPGLDPARSGNPSMVDPDRWQPLALTRFVGQSGFEGSPAFVGPEWGFVTPFALKSSDRTVKSRDGDDYLVYHDPGPPPSLRESGASPNAYQWGFALVAAWSGHLDPADGVQWDISPGAMGNLGDLPFDATLEEFYDLARGGDPGRGRATNPATGSAYAPNVVPRADYARVLAEFWADGPDSETPPGHWFTILHGVMDHPDFERRWRGAGAELDPLEYDVKAFLALGGAMHDAAIAAWSVKGWYDYVRPVSALRCMAEFGQSTEVDAANYHPEGLPLIDGMIESIDRDDPLAGFGGVHTGKIKLRAWRGPFAVEDPATDVAGVDWIRAEDWWPYQRPSFVTPPFAGYVSGHSTFSRAAAEVLTRMTGSSYFPGGMGEFVAPRNEFLVFEEGPSVDVVLQWATYQDAADQCSLSRIWGGIHPPVDDLPGRVIGRQVGVDAFARAERVFADDEETLVSAPALRVFPNPVRGTRILNLEMARPSTSAITLDVFDARGRRLRRELRPLDAGRRFLSLDLGAARSGVYFVRLRVDGIDVTERFVLVR